MRTCRCELGKPATVAAAEPASGELTTSRTERGAPTMPSISVTCEQEREVSQIVRVHRTGFDLQAHHRKLCLNMHRRTSERCPLAFQPLLACCSFCHPGPSARSRMLRLNAVQFVPTDCGRQMSLSWSGTDDAPGIVAGFDRIPKQALALW